jgi:hypothetical protein
LGIVSLLFVVCGVYFLREAWFILSFNFSFRFESLALLTSSIWNWEEGVKISKFSNTQSTNSRISDLAIINEHSNPLICMPPRCWRD